MGSIRILPTEVVNRIAAGEVIERPASLVKELVENSLDAGATRIRVEVEEGGRVRVRVTDDGGGVAPTDLALAFEPHATSKLATADDLFRISTFGFRGEALASIGAVARVRMRSRVREAEGGAEVSVDGGAVSPVKPAPCPEGTDLEVRHLFFNLPARMKFLRNPEVEFEHIHETLARFAVSHPGVRLELRSNGGSVFALDAVQDVRERIGAFFGKDLAEALMEVRSEEEPAPFTALLSPPSFSKLTLKGQYVYLNGRFIRDRILTRAINEAYREVLPHGRYAVAFLFLTVKPDEVDVNVHPTKVEVRFRHVWRIHDLLLSRLRERLLGADLAPSALRAAAGAPPPDVYREVVEFFAPSAPGAPDPAPLLSTPRRFFQVHDRYIVEEAEEGIRILDQHALHERVMLDRLRRAWSGGDLPSQRLLLPSVVTLTPGQMGLLEEHGDVLRAAGFSVDPSGPKSAAVRAIPAALRDDDPASLLQDLAERLEEHGESERKEGHAIALVEPLLEFLACRSAVRFGNRLTAEEVARLLRDAEELDYSATCAHGRPTAVQLTLEELERLFQRK